MKYDEKLVKDIINCMDTGISQDPDFFGINTDEDDFPLLYTIGSNLDMHDINGTINYGVSKCVFIPDDAEIVVKTPFSGQFVYEYSEELDDPHFIRFHKANIDAEGEADTDWDYCENELIKYQRAVDDGFGEFYAETAWFDTLYGQPYYIQEKVIPFEDSDKRTPSEDSRKKYDSSIKGTTYLDKEWLCVAIDMYGLDRVKAFIQYLKDTKTCDLHRGNYGYTLTGHPVLLDWSGWRDSQG